MKKWKLLMHNAKARKLINWNFKRTVWTNPLIVCFCKFSSYRLFRTNWAIAFAIIFIFQYSLEASAKSFKESAIVPVLDILPKKSNTHNEQTETKAVSKAVAVSTLEKLKKVEHRPYPYLSGLVMGILIFLIIYRLCCFNSNKKS